MYVQSTLCIFSFSFYKHHIYVSQLHNCMYIYDEKLAINRLLVSKDFNQ